MDAWDKTAHPPRSWPSFPKRVTLPESTIKLCSGKAWWSVKPKHGCTLGKRVPNLGQPRCWPSVSPCCMTSTIEPGQTTPSLLIGYNLKPDPNSCGKPKFDCPTKCLESWPSNQEKAVGLQKGRVGQDTPPTTELALFSQACHVT